ncbi:hypothetical protein GCM10022215_10690 [Nocardioides fonticola]|uniref:L,D-TPase catalytic domain-containing protein n=1 Tax=Nocardioides fonticola TaxID=450363 RepID=A0ABP7XEC0_9ACTN
MARHRAQVRPRYGRIALVGGSLLITLVAVLGGVGVLPVDGPDTLPASASVAPATPSAPASSSTSRTTAPATSPTSSAGEAADAAPSVADTTLPAASGTGRRVVFDRSRQRVWLVRADGTVASTYLVSGSVSDNLDAGRYAVFSRSQDAVGIDDSGTMRWFVRFTRGPSGAAIGFHTIPIDEGRRVQTIAELGTPQSHGCIRQRDTDAKRLWDFAPLGTRVVVL